MKWKTMICNVALAGGIVCGGLFLSIPSAEAVDVWACTTTNGDKAYVESETVYNDGANFGCKVKLYYARTSAWHVEDFYFGLDENGHWFCMRNGHTDPLIGSNVSIFNVAKQYR